jgi:hypothetical protein
MLAYPDEAVVEEEADQGSAHGGVLSDDRLGLRARRAVEARHQRRARHGHSAQRSGHEQHG